MGQPTAGDQLRPLVYALVASSAVHVLVLQYLDGPAPADAVGRPDRRVLTVELARRVAERPTDDLTPVDPTPAIVAPPIEPVVSAPDRPAEPPAPAAPDSTPAFHSLDVRAFVKRYEPPDDHPVQLRFRPDLRRQVEARRAERDRQTRVADNRVHRSGHSAEQVSSTESMVKIGDDCYALSAPAITIQRGQQVSAVECPGGRPWWKRDGLESVATFRGIP